jgi:hypothetical protein
MVCTAKKRPTHTAKKTENVTQHTKKKGERMTGGGFRSATGKTIQRQTTFYNTEDPHERLYNSIGGGVNKKIYLHILHKEYESDQEKIIWMSSHFAEILNELGESMKKFKYREGVLLVPLGEPTGNTTEDGGFQYDDCYAIEHLSWQKNQTLGNFRFWRKKIIIPLCTIALLIFGGVYIYFAIDALTFLTSFTQISHAMAMVPGMPAASSSVGTLTVADVTTIMGDSVVLGSKTTLSVVGQLVAIVCAELFVMIKAGKNYKKSFWRNVKTMIGKQMSPEKTELYENIINKVILKSQNNRTKILKDLENIVNTDKTQKEPSKLRLLVKKMKEDSEYDYFNELKTYCSAQRSLSPALRDVLNVASEYRNNARNRARETMKTMDTENMYRRFKPALHRHIKMKNAGWHVKILYNDNETHIKHITLHYKYEHSKAIMNSVGVLIATKTNQNGWVWKVARRDNRQRMSVERRDNRQRMSMSRGTTRAPKGSAGLQTAQVSPRVGNRHEPDFVYNPLV